MHPGTQNPLPNPLPTRRRNRTDEQQFLALVRRIEDLLDLPVPLGDLIEDARAWELGVDELAADNDEVMTYVHQLEESHDAETPESTSGEHIAAEFERYLRRRENS